MFETSELLITRIRLDQIMVEVSFVQKYVVRSFIHSL